MDSGIRGKVDVIIPAYQAESFIRRAMDSVRLQGETVNQVFIVDNASTDGTSDVVQRYIDEYGLAHWKLMHESRKGAPAARNHPLHEVTAEWIQFLDADDELLEGKLAGQVSFSKRHRCDVVAGESIHQHHQEGQVYEKPNRNVRQGLISGNLGNTCANLFRARFILEIGGWNVGLSSSQEYDLMFRLWKNGAVYQFIEESKTLIHEGPSGRISTSNLPRKWKNHCNVQREMLLAFMESHHSSQDLNDWLQAHFSCIRILRQHDPEEALRFWRVAEFARLVPKVKQQFEESLGEPIASAIALPQKLQVKLHKLEVKRVEQLIKRSNVDLLICRNASSCFLALQARALSKQNAPRICYDGRGALKAEAEEYGVYPKHLIPHLIRAEKTSVLESDHRIAVSEELVAWWKSGYGYASEKHSIIPTTISTLHQHFDPAMHRKEWREKFGFTTEDTVIAFAGGKADWQGLDFWLPHLHEWLKNMPNLKLLLLTPENPSITEIRNKFPKRIVNTFVAHHDVLKALSSADYGILWRTPNNTNLVASPTKLSEYVQAGLVVVTNQGTAVARFVKKNILGVCVNPKFDFEQLTRLACARQGIHSVSLIKKNFYPELLVGLE